MIKILLADDHQMFIDGMRVLIDKKNDMQIVAEANNAAQVLDILEEKAPEINVAILDIEMPEKDQPKEDTIDGIQLTRIIKKKYKHIKILILSMFDKKEFIIKLMRYGASGYILKNKSKEELIMAIYNVSAGKTHYSLEVLEHAVAVSAIDEDEEVTLTEREIEVLKTVGEGASAKEAADQLGISETTVNTHRRNIMSKLNLPSATHLVRYAIKHGYVEL